MARPYTLRKRAERQAGTRQKIVEATVALHGSVGPAATTLSMIAERAGVQRHTLYAHFPDERSLYLACSGFSLERDPLPQATDWRAIDDRRERLCTGLAALHGWYARNADLAACVLRDAEHHELTREITALRFDAPMHEIREVLGESMTPRQRALLELAMRFHTWRTLTREAGLGASEAVDVLVDAIVREGGGQVRRASATTAP